MGRRFAVVQRLGRGRVAARAVIAGVPEEISSRRVSMAVRRAGMDVAAGGAPLVVLAEERWPAKWDFAGGRVESLTWEALEARQAARRISVVVSPELWARATLAAAQAGESLNSWLTSLVEEAAP